MKGSVPYNGPVCYVGHDHEAADGRPLEGGWHYTVIPVPDAPEPGENESPHTMPGEKLYLDPKTGKYRLATATDKSWHVRHHKRLKLVAVEGDIGEPRTAEEVEAAHRHLNELEERLSSEGLHRQEHDHVLASPDQIRAARGWLNRRKS